MTKIISYDEVQSLFKDDMSLMSGGFMSIGTPEYLVSAILESNVSGLTLMCSDTGTEEKGVGPLIVNRRVKKLYASHIGTNPETGRQMMSDEEALDVELCPQGTFAERIRAGGAGLGGFLTSTGVGTVVEEGKDKLIVNDKEYLLELPLTADVAILKAKKADRFGNLVFHQSAQNFNPLMALAADLVIAEVEEVVEVGDIDPHEVGTTGVLVDKLIVKGGNDK